MVFVCIPNCHTHIYPHPSPVTWFLPPFSKGNWAYLCGSTCGFFFFFSILIFILWVWVSACVYVSAPYACLMPTEAKRRCQIPQNWSHRSFRAVMWVLGTWLRSSTRAASVCDHWAISPARFWVLYSLSLEYSSSSLHCPSHQSEADAVFLISLIQMLRVGRYKWWTFSYTSNKKEIVWSSFLCTSHAYSAAVW